MGIILCAGNYINTDSLSLRYSEMVWCGLEGVYQQHFPSWLQCGYFCTSYKQIWNLMDWNADLISPRSIGMCAKKLGIFGWFNDDLNAILKQQTWRDGAYGYCRKTKKKFGPTAIRQEGPWVVVGEIWRMNFKGCSRWFLFPHWLIPKTRFEFSIGIQRWGIYWIRCRTFEGPLWHIRKKQAVLDVCPEMSGTTLDVSERNWRKESPIRRSNGPTLKMAWFFWVPGTHDGPNPEFTWKWGIVGHSKDQSHSKLRKVPWRNSAIWWFPKIGLPPNNPCSMDFPFNKLTIFQWIIFNLLDFPSENHPNLRKKSAAAKPRTGSLRASGKPWFWLMLWNFWIIFP